MHRNAIDDITKILRNGEAQVIKRSWTARTLVGKLDGYWVHIDYDMLPQSLMIRCGTFKPDWGAPFSVEYGNVELPKDSWYGEFMIR